MLEITKWEQRPREGSLILQEVQDVTLRICIHDVSQTVSVSISYAAGETATSLYSPWKSKKVLPWFTPNPSYALKTEYIRLHEYFESSIPHYCWFGLWEHSQYPPKWINHDAISPFCLSFLNLNFELKLNAQRCPSLPEARSPNSSRPVHITYCSSRFVIERSKEILNIWSSYSS